MAHFKHGKKVSQTNLKPSTAVDDTDALNQALLESFAEMGLTLESDKPLVKAFKAQFPTVDTLSLRQAWSTYTLSLEVEADKQKTQSQETN